MKHSLLLGAVSALTLVATSAGATPPATPAERLLHSWSPPAKPIVWPHLELTSSEAIAQMKLIAAWDVTMQSTACPMPDAGPDAGPDACTTGGIIEVESGPGMEIVASDNTQETIGLWSIDPTLGDGSYPTNIDLAFGYLATHPGYLAWQLTGDPGPDYYSVYNCGWGVRAVILYEKETGDMSHHAYGETCAQHIATNADTLAGANATLLDVGPAGWGASGLWMWGDTYPEDAAMKTTAATIGGDVKAWIEAMPSRISYQQWAMTGAAPYYGVLGSYMKENPSELSAWVTEYGPMLGGWVDESTPATPNDWTDWRNAWNGWNMLAQFTTSDLLGPSAGANNLASANDILAKLVAQANPTTGAIPGSQQRPNTEAESWITAYMVYFGLLHVIDAEAADAGVDAGGKDAGADGGAKHDAGVDAGKKDAALVLGGSSSSSSELGPMTDGGSKGCSCTVTGSERGEAGGAGLASLALVALAWSRRRKGPSGEAT